MVARPPLSSKLRSELEPRGLLRIHKVDIMATHSYVVGSLADSSIKNKSSSLSEHGHCSHKECNLSYATTHITLISNRPASVESHGG